MRWEPSVRSCYGLRGVRVGETSHPGPQDHTPEDIFPDLEVALTRIDLLDEELLVRPTTGRHVIRKVREEQSRFLIFGSTRCGAGSVQCTPSGSGHNPMEGQLPPRVAQ